VYYYQLFGKLRLDAFPIFFLKKNFFFCKKQEFRRYWSVVCNMDSSMIGYVLQMARDDLESVPLYGSWVMNLFTKRISQLIGWK